MPDNTINWGQGAVENTNDWGKGKTNSANNWGKIYETSPAGDTNIEGGLALSITYSASAYCDGIGDTPQPTVANNTGAGTFSSTSGIIFADSGSNTGSSTGVIDVDASTDGATYVITYTDTDSDTATANVTLNALDNAAFAYSASSYEPTDADPTPTITGLTGGTFSAGSGLVFVDSGTNTGSSTGEIDLSASTIASYTITYNTTSSGSSVCPNTSTQTVEIALAGIANNYSMSFDGINDYININPDPLSYQTQNNYSFSVWAKCDSSDVGVTFGGDIMSNDVSGRFTMYYYNQYFRVMLYPTNLQISVTLSSVNLDNNNWNHIALTGDVGNNLLKLYVNGQLVHTKTSGVKNYRIYTGGLNIGTDWEGNLDEIGIWNTTLTATQVSEIYNATSAGRTKDLSTIEPSNLKYFNRMGD